jgi:hypothetical protein
VNLRKISAVAGGLLAAGALSLGATAASASVTPDCTIVFGSFCTTPLVAQAPLAADNQMPADDYALRYTGPDPAAGVGYGNVAIDFNQNTGDGTEDFTAVELGTVPHHGKGLFGFTKFDNAQYAGDPIYEYEYTPFGSDTGLCLTVSNFTRLRGLVLGVCTSNVRQGFVLASHAFDLNAAPSPYDYVFQAAHSTLDAEQHNFLLDPPHPGNDNLAATGTPLNGGGANDLELWTDLS